MYIFVTNTNKNPVLTKDLLVLTVNHGAENRDFNLRVHLFRAEWNGTMGLSSSQARLLNLTGRMHQIEYKAAKLEAEKLQMANKSRQVYNEY